MKRATGTRQSRCAAARGGRVDDANAGSSIATSDGAPNATPADTTR